LRQPLWAPPAFGTAIVTGVASALISAYEIGDCLQYRTKRGECHAVIEQNALPLVTGIAAILGPLGGLFTYNHKLDTPGQPRDKLGRYAPKQKPRPGDEPQGS